MSSKGVILFAKNNGKIDYVKQAIFLTNRIHKYLNLPVSLITDSLDYAIRLDTNKIFDNIIEIDYKEVGNSRRCHDGSLSSQIVSFKNDSRYAAYELTPYSETLLMDTDYIISNSNLAECFNIDHDFLIYKNSSDIANVRDEYEFTKISDYSIDFYWATVVFFRKTNLNQIFFNLVAHIQDEWPHYRRVYQVDSPLFRNDYAFSIAVHIMNGFQLGDFAKPLPGKKIYSIDRDLLWNLVDDEMTFLVEKKDYLGEYTILKTKGHNVHVMNKFSLERIINDETHND